MNNRYILKGDEMKRMINVRCMLMLILIVAATVGYWPHQDKAYAGGGINHKVTVQNPTELQCKVKVWVDKVTVAGDMGEKTIQPGGSQTWETGAWCPIGVTGNIYSSVDKRWFKMQDTNCYGNKQSMEWAPACCWNTTLEVTRKVGTGYSNVRDEDYGFSKN